MAEVNGNGRFNLFGIPFSVWMVLLGQFAGLVVWAIRLDGRVNHTEELVKELAEQDTVPGRLLKQRVDQMQQRQDYLTNYVLLMREQLVRAAPSQPLNLPPLRPDEQK